MVHNTFLFLSVTRYRVQKLHNEICSLYLSKQRNKQCQTHKIVQIHSETVFSVSSLLMDDDATYENAGQEKAGQENVGQENDGQQHRARMYS